MELIDPGHAGDHRAAGRHRADLRALRRLIVIDVHRGDDVIKHLPVGETRIRKIAGAQGAARYPVVRPGSLVSAVDVITGKVGLGVVAPVEVDLGVTRHSRQSRWRGRGFEIAAAAVKILVSIRQTIGVIGRLLPVEIFDHAAGATQLQRLSNARPAGLGPTDIRKILPGCRPISGRETAFIGQHMAHGPCVIHQRQTIRATVLES